MANFYDFTKIYGESFSEKWADELHVIPKHMIPSLVRYMLWGIRPGEFLTALLQGNFFECLKKADDLNKHALYEYGSFLYRAAPPDCFGTPDKVRAWITQQGALHSKPPKEVW